MNRAIQIEGAHLVGSVPLADAETVFRTVSGALGRYLERLPDGETGVRKDWIAWQYAVLASTPGLEPIPVGDRGYLRRQMVRLAGDREAPRFGPLGYAQAALASYPIFARLQREGVIAEATRFQVSLPTPLAPMTVFVNPEDRAVVEPAYELRLLEELRLITEAIPRSKLAIQWDVAAEFGHLEGVWPAHFPEVDKGVIDRLARIGAAVPAGVALGYHLCYGDFGHKHFVNPASARKLVQVANALLALPRPLSWIHMAVPSAWTDAEPFEPLSRLALPERTRLYLGVVHMSDGLDGARRRIEMAGRSMGRFGVATECGWGRRPPESIPALLALHTALLAG